jgi:hypothetical protein
MPGFVLGPLFDFANLIAAHLAEIWAFLVFIGRLSGVLVILVGAILWLTEVNTTKGKGLVLSGILLSVVVQYFVTYPPVFQLG